MTHNPIFFDVHTHVSFPVYDEDRPAVMRRAKEARVKMITVGTQASSSRAAIELAREYPEDVWATVGFHPSHAVVGSPDATAGANSGKAGIWHHDKNEQKEDAPEKFDVGVLEVLAKNPKVVAIGECGLDYFRIKNESLKVESERQKEVFIKQIELAHKLQKPLMIHCRSAFPELIKIIIHNSKFIIHRNPGVIHFFSGALDEARVLASMGFAFTFGGVITFSHDYDEVIKTLPLDNILSETDAPYVSPAPYRGKCNEPAYVVETVKKLAEIKNITTDEMAAVVWINAKRIFGI